MNLKKAGMVLLLMGSIAMVTGCASETEEKKEVKKEEKKEYYKGELTEEEMNDTHLTLELMENVTVDADITSLKDYENGVKSYFIQRPDGEKIAPGKKKIEGKGYIPKDYKQVKNLIAENVEGTFEKKKDESFYRKKERLITSALLTDSISGKVFSYDIELDRKNRPSGKRISLYRYFESDNKEEYKYYVSDGDIIWRLLYNSLDFEESDFSFGGKEEMAGKLKEQAEGIIGKKLSGVYDGYAVSRDVYDMIIQEQYAEEQYISCPADCYIYYFYHDIDGFPWKTESTNYFLEGDEKFAEYVDVQGGTDYTMQPENQMISYGKDGIRELSMSDTVECSKVYKEEKVLPLDEMLIKIGDYFLANPSNTLMKNLISEIKVCYISYFSDKEEGTMQNIAKPCWEVVIGQKHYDGVKYSSIYFDATTGEYLTGYLEH